MRALALLLCVTLSGLPALASDAFGAESSDGCSSCPGETDTSGSESTEHQSCSPICPDCVCSLAARTTLPVVLLVSGPEPIRIDDVPAATPIAATAPREPALDGVFHPPKH